MSHLKEQEEGYWEHFLHAAMFSLTLLGLAIICLVHAIIPNIFTTTASCRLEALVKEMKRCDCDEDTDE